VELHRHLRILLVAGCLLPTFQAAVVDLHLALEHATPGDHHHDSVPHRGDDADENSHPHSAAPAPHRHSPSGEWNEGVTRKATDGPSLDLGLGAPVDRPVANGSLVRGAALRPPDRDSGSSRLARLVVFRN
jgi:hypothetical protein